MMKNTLTTALIFSAFLCAGYIIPGAGIAHKDGYFNGATAEYGSCRQAQNDAKSLWSDFMAKNPLRYYAEEVRPSFSCEKREIGNGKYAYRVPVTFISQPNHAHWSDCEVKWRPGCPDHRHGESSADIIPVSAEQEAEQERQRQEEQARLAEQARQQQAEQDALFEQQLLQGLSQQSETKKQADANYRESVSEAAVEAEELKRDIEQSSKEFNDFRDELNQRAAQGIPTGAAAAGGTATAAAGTTGGGTGATATGTTGGGTGAATASRTGGATR